MQQAPLPNPVFKKILDLSFFAFSQKGYKGVSMDVVARELKISKKTIYVHFHSKEEILETALEELFSKINKEVSKAVTINDEAKALVAIFEVYKTFHQDLSPRLRREIHLNMPHLEDRCLAFERRVIHNKLVKWLKNLRKSKPILYPSPTREMASTMLQMMSGLLPSPEEKAHFVLHALIKGMQVAKKKKK